MELSNSIYFEHKGSKISATVKEDIATDPKLLFVTPNETDELGQELKFEWRTNEWVGPDELKKNFPETYNSMLSGINNANYTL